MVRRILLALALIIATTVYGTANAGDWLGGQYWGQISGCGSCGGSLYGWGNCYGGKGIAPTCGDCLSNPDAPLPLPAVSGAPAATGVDAIPDPHVPILRTAYSTPQEGISSRRVPHDDILPIAASDGDVSVFTHASQPERLTPQTPRLVAPNAWSDRLYR